MLYKTKGGLLWERHADVDFLFHDHVFKEVFFVQKQKNGGVLENIFPVGVGSWSGFKC
jgi:hypothetical protein